MSEGGADTPKPTSEQLTQPQGLSEEKKPEGALGGLNIIPERFSIGKDNDPKKYEERIKEIANTPPDQLLKSSQWRRDLAASQPDNKPAQPASDPNSSNK